MAEYGGNILLDQGFKNVWQDGKIVGFQVRVLISYYRGVPFSLIGGYDIEVDGELFTSDQVNFSVDGVNFYTLEELGPKIDEVWEYGVKAYLRVNKIGGLKRGLHDVKVVSRVDVPYMGPVPITTYQSRKMTVV